MNKPWMDRINADIRKDAEDRRLFVNCRNDQLELGLSGDKLQTILHISDSWAFGERHIGDVFFGRLEPRNSEQAAHRLALTESVSDRIDALLRGDQIRIVRWVRRAFSVLGGRRPLDLLMGHEAEVQ
jgi:hypothetical protein